MEGILMGLCHHEEALLLKLLNKKAKVGVLGDPTSMLLTSTSPKQIGLG